MLQNIDAETQPVLDVLSGGSSKELRLPKKAGNRARMLPSSDKKNIRTKKKLCS